MKTVAIWHRPNDTGEETDLNGLKRVLYKFCLAGINLVFLESFYHGAAIYRSKYVPYNPSLKVFRYGSYPDYLSAFVTEAGKLGIEVHAWVEDFYIGIKDSVFTRRYREWILKTKDDGIRQTEGDGFLFLDPANAEVREFLLKIYLELLGKHPLVKGLNLDYIRYPVSSESDDAGYTKAALAAFGEQYGATPAEDYKNWIKFRADAVTAFVKSVKEEVKPKFPDIRISTAVFPERELSYETKKQDFAEWLKQGYLDFVTPMAYYDDLDKLKETLTEMIGFCKETPCFAGLSCTYHGLSEKDVLAQIDLSLSLGAQGVVFFGSKSILENTGYLLILNKKFCI